MKKLIVVCVAILMFCCTGFATAGITTGVYVDSMPLNFTSLSETNPAGMWYQIEHWAAAEKAAIMAGTFVDMANGTYPGTHTISIDDDVLTVTGSASAYGKAIMWSFLLKTDEAVNIQVREACTYTFVQGGTTSIWDDVAGAWLAGSSTMAWQSIYNANPYGVNIPLAAGGNIYQGWWEYMDSTSSLLPDLTAINYYVEYSTNQGGTWVPGASGSVSVIPEPATICLIGLGVLGLLRKKQ
ncbi:MAG: PEP-CTERM sorting domain-containing protein [Sedimentisphaerales bacterium]